MLLLVGAMHFVAVRAAITKQLAPYVHIIKNSDVCSTIHQIPMYVLLESVLGVKRAEVRQSVADVTLSLCYSQCWPPSTLVRLGSYTKSKFGTTG